MAWVRIDDSFLTNAKALAAGKDGRALIIAGLCYSAANLTDGFIADSALSMLAGAAEVKAKPTATLLVQIDAWHREGHSCDRCPPVPSGRYLIHDFLDYHPTRAQVEADREAGAERQRRSRVSRRDRPRDRPGDQSRDRPVTNGSGHGVASDDPSPKDCSKNSPLQPSASARGTSGQTAESITTEAADLDLDSAAGSPDARAIRAIDWLAWERTNAAKNVRSRKRYHDGVVEDLRAEHWSSALANARTGWTPRDIACRIENASHRPRPRAVEGGAA